MKYIYFALGLSALIIGGYLFLRKQNNKQNNDEINWEEVC